MGSATTVTTAARVAPVGSSWPAATPDQNGETSASEPQSSAALL